MKTYKVIYSIQATKNSKPFNRTYCFSTVDKRTAMRTANDILCDYIIDMKYYVGSIIKIKELK